MYQRLSAAKLKTGEEIEVGVVTAPDEEYLPQLTSFLGHKGELWRWQAAKALKGEIKDLAMRFYISLLNGEVISNVCTWEWQGMGVFGHVYTSPAQRKKGACKLIINRLMEDVKGRGGRLLSLGTKYQGIPYQIYESFSFKNIEEGSGCMRWCSRPDYLAQYYKPGTATVRRAEWKDWPRASILYGIAQKDYLRSFTFALFGRGFFEYYFLQVMKGLQEESFKDARVIESESGAIVGLATLGKDPKWPGAVYLLDFFYHEAFAASAAALIQAVDFTAGKTQCYIDSLSSGRRDVLEKAGFALEATLEKQIEDKDKPLDVLIYSRR